MDGDETEWGTVAWGFFCGVFPSPLNQNFSAMEILAVFEAIHVCNPGFDDLHQCTLNSAELLCQ